MRFTETPKLSYRCNLTLAYSINSNKKEYTFKFLATEKIKKKNMYKALVNEVKEITYHIPTKTLRIYNSEGSRQIEMIIDPERSEKEAIVYKLMETYNNGAEADKHLCLTTSYVVSTVCILAVLFNETTFTD